MKSNYFLTLTAFFAITAFSACKKNIEAPAENLTEKPVRSPYCMKYGLTQCADPWHEWCGTPPVSSDSIRIMGYFHIMNINAQITSILQEGGEVNCEACNCPNGRVLYVEVADSNRTKLGNIGFLSCGECGN